MEINQMICVVNRLTGFFVMCEVRGFWTKTSLTLLSLKLLSAKFFLVCILYF